MARADKITNGASASFVGAHVVRLVVDEEAGDYADPEILAVAGIVPDSQKNPAGRGGMHVGKERTVVE
ncbi:hypothetical protein AAJCM20276_27460 [Acetobacter aceti]|uniref:Uncharacterized protein n=1 Tax=Acetobacter aceti TaxID=435 RepID=A0A6S6PTS1_ACEAC|nr:hypothetical protein [Acetobacter aceti]BCI68122.1 hypothetical protein AAJCM20276_27460 [Acetobacter aceti]